MMYTADLIVHMILQCMYLIYYNLAVVEQFQEINLILNPKNNFEFYKMQPNA